MSIPLTLSLALQNSTSQAPVVPRLDGTTQKITQEILTVVGTCPVDRDI